MADDHDPTSREPVRPPTDYRAMRRRNDRSLFLAVIAVLLVVGGGLIYIQDAIDSNMNPQAITAVGGSQPHTNFQPYLCVDFIISLFGIFPSQT